MKFNDLFNKLFPSNFFKVVCRVKTGEVDVNRY